MGIDVSQLNFEIEPLISRAAHNSALHYEMTKYWVYLFTGLVFTEMIDNWRGQKFGAIHRVFLY